MRVKNAKKFALATIILAFISLALEIVFIINGFLFKEPEYLKDASLNILILALSIMLELLGILITYITFYIITIVNGFHYKIKVGSILMCVGLVVSIVGIVGAFFVYFDLKRKQLDSETLSNEKPMPKILEETWNNSNNEESQEQDGE